MPVKKSLPALCHFSKKGTFWNIQSNSLSAITTNEKYLGLSSCSEAAKNKLANTKI